MSELFNILSIDHYTHRGIEYALYKSAIHQRDEKAFALICKEGDPQYTESVFSKELGHALLRSQWNSGFKLWLTQALELIGEDQKPQYLDNVMQTAKLHPDFLDIFVHDAQTTLKNTTNPKKLLNIAKRLSCVAITANRPDIFDECFAVLEVLDRSDDLQRELWPKHAECFQETPHIWVVDKWLTRTHDPMIFNTLWSTTLKYGATSDLLELLNCGFRHLDFKGLQVAYEELFYIPMHVQTRWPLCENFDAFAQSNNWPLDKRYPPAVSRQIAQLASNNIIPPTAWQPWVDKMVLCDQLQLSNYFHMAEKVSNWQVIKYIHANHTDYMLDRLAVLMKDPDPTWVEAAVGEIGDDVDRVLVHCRHSTPILEALKQRIQISDAIGSTTYTKSKKM